MSTWKQQAKVFIHWFPAHRWRVFTRTNRSPTFPVWACPQQELPYIGESLWVSKCPWCGWGGMPTEWSEFELAPELQLNSKVGQRDVTRAPGVPVTTVNLQKHLIGVIHLNEHKVTADRSVWCGLLKEAGFQLSLERTDRISHPRNFATYQDLKFSSLSVLKAAVIYSSVLCLPDSVYILFFSYNNITLMVMAFRYLSNACLGFNTKKILPQFKWF